MEKSCVPHNRVASCHLSIVISLKTSPQSYVRGPMCRVESRHKGGGLLSSGGARVSWPLADNSKAVFWIVKSSK